MKKAISIVLALILVASLAPGALATSTATITAYDSTGEQVGGTYTTIDAAAVAAGQGGKVSISAGVLEVDGRQTISVSGVTLEGAGRGVTIIKPSASFASASETNRKAILTIAADNVTVKDLSLDGTDYGSTIDMDDETEYDFVILRINSGSGIALDDIYVTGSPKTLIQLGMSNTSVTVTATDLYCQGMTKQINENATYPDIDLNNSSTLEVNGGVLHAFISDIGEDSCNLINCEPVYTLVYTYMFILHYYLHSTFQHYANSYVETKDIPSSIFGTYVGAINDSSNQTVIGNMVDHAEEVARAGSDDTSVENFITLLTDAKSVASGDFVNTLSSYITRLEVALAETD